MKLRWQKLLLVKPKSAIGVSMLDVISNALASIILLFFVLVALRSLPPPPERVLGILVVDYEMRWNEDAGTPERQPEMEVFLRGPKLEAGAEPLPRFGREIEDLRDADAFTTGAVDSVQGVWPGAKVLESRGPGYVRKRVFYFNPKCPGPVNKQAPCEWLAGAIYVDDTAYFDTRFPVLKDEPSISVQAWFLKGGSEQHLKPHTLAASRITQFPSHKSVELKFEIPTYQVVSAAK